MPEPKVLLLVGSPKESKSTSDVVGSYLLKKLEGRGYISEKYYVSRLIQSDVVKNNFLNAVVKADLVILSSPLYIDSLPSVTIRLLQAIKEYKQSCEQKHQGFVAIFNSGFPESDQNNTALQICRRFAAESDFQWLGGLPIGGGAGIDGQPIEKYSKLYEKIIKSLDLSADALANAKPIPEEALRIIKDYPTKWLYYISLKLRIRYLTYKNGALKQIHNQPFKDNDN